jgi:hypothetical protein
LRVRDHLLAASGAGIRIPELEVPDFPAPAEHLWRVFQRLQQSRQVTSGALLPLTYQEILAYTTLMDDPLAPWEVMLLKLLDMIYLKLGVQHGS